MIGILAYSYSDVATIMENATILNQKKIGNVTYYLVNINGNQVYVILVGAGIVNVACG